MSIMKCAVAYLDLGHSRPSAVAKNSLERPRVLTEEISNPFTPLWPKAVGIDIITYTPAAVIVPELNKFAFGIL